MHLLHATGALRAASPAAARARSDSGAAGASLPRRVAGALATLVLATVVVAALAAGVAGAAGVRPHVEASDSMRPALRAGDLVWLRDVAASEAAVGDVVAFRHAQRGDLVLHRVVERRTTGGRIAFTTRGDANTGVERWSAPASGTLGRASGLRLPHAGRVVAALAGPPLAVLAALAGLALAALLLRRLWR